MDAFRASMNLVLNMCHCSSNYTKNQMRPTMLHNMENIIQTVTCTTNQSMAHHETNNSNTCGTTSTLDHQALKQSDTAKMKKGSRQYRKCTIQNASKQTVQELYLQILQSLHGI